MTTIDEVFAVVLEQRDDARVIIAELREELRQVTAQRDKALADLIEVKQ